MMLDGRFSFHSKRARHSSCFRLLPVILAVLNFGLAGCGGSSSSKPPTPVTPTATATATPIAGAVFSPVMPPLDPDTVGTTPSQKSTITAAHALAAATAAPIALDHFFYLVNGTGLPPADANGVITSPVTSPQVLTVNGAAPNGAPAPNGGIGVGTALMNPNSTGRQLWKAVDAGGGYFFLRSAESFKTVQDPSSTIPDNPSLLLGYGATALALDLGFLSSWNTSVFINQLGNYAGSPPDQSANSNFQQWSYNTTNGQLTNRDADGQLYNSTPTAWVGRQAAAPGNQWYAYPNYFLETVVNEANSNPPFPAASDAGELAAYNYMSLLVGAESATCTLEGTPYTGIRCEYYNLNSGATQSCAGDAPLWATSQSFNPGTFEGTAISASDWTNVAMQLAKECQYAQNVQLMYSNFATIANAIFTGDSNQIISLATDIGLSENQSVSAVPIQIIEGLLYTVLSASGNNGIGAMANLMETAVNTAVAQGGQQAQDLTQALISTVGSLYSDLNNSFVVLTSQAANGETSILQDWGRLSQIGPLTEINGYNGLGLTPGQFPAIEAAALKGYSVAVMQQLMAVAPWARYGDVATTFSSIGGPPSSAQYSYYSFGSNTQNYNNLWMEDPSHASNYPDSQVIDTDILGNGGNAFELFNGINGWTALPFAEYQNFTCYGGVVTLYNATPSYFSVNVVRGDGFIAAPGANFNAGGQESGSTGSATFDLFPYSYLPIYAGSRSSSNTDFNASVSLNTGGSQVGSFNFGLGNACGGGSLNVGDIEQSGGYSILWSGTTSGGGHNSPPGDWITILN